MFKLTDYTIAVVRDAVDVLQSCAEEENGSTLTELAMQTGLGKNKVFRILYTLQACRLIFRDENARFHLGFRLAELAQNLRFHNLLLEVSKPIMQELLEETQESIFLGVPSEHNALCIAALESTRSVRLYARVGILSPFYLGGVPKVLLANMEPSVREGHLSHFQATVADETVDWPALRGKLAEIREQGYSITVDELDLGAHSVSAPIYDYSGQVVASISIAGPSIRFSDDRIQRYVRLVTAATLRISRSLGYNPSHDNSLGGEELLLNII